MLFFELIFLFPRFHSRIQYSDGFCRITIYQGEVLKFREMYSCNNKTISLVMFALKGINGERLFESWINDACKWKSFRCICSSPFNINWTGTGTCCKNKRLARIGFEFGFALHLIIRFSIFFIRYRVWRVKMSNRTIFV